MRIAVTGRHGQVATALIERGELAGHPVITLARPDFDLADPTTALPAMAAARADVVVSAAAYTAVDRAESEPDLARAINGIGAGTVAAAARTLGLPVIHLSTDYVFDGTKPTPYVETDPTGPLSTYGASKLMGEQMVAAANPDHVILRVAWIYSPFGANFVRTMLRLAETRDTLNVVADQLGGPTSALDIADAILAVATRLVGDPAPDLRGLFHLAPPDMASWADFASAIFAGAAARGRTVPRVIRIPASDYPAPARRPANSRLDAARIAALHGIALPSWRTSLETCLGRLIQTGN